MEWLANVLWDIKFISRSSILRFPTRFMSFPNLYRRWEKEHFEAAMGFVYYIKGKLGQGILL